MTPRASLEEPVQDGVRYTFHVAAAETPTKIVLALEPGAIGTIRTQVAVSDSAPVQIHQFIYP